MTQDRTRKAGKMREREDRGEKRNATAFVESRMRGLVSSGMKSHVIG